MTPAGSVRVETRPRTGLVVAGAVLFGVGWLVGGAITVAIDAADDGEVSGASGFTFIPLAGPWIDLATQELTGGQAAGILAQGILEVVGLTMFIVGLAARREVQVPTAFIGDGADQRATLRVAPGVVGQQGVGLVIQIGEL